MQISVGGAQTNNEFLGEVGEYIMKSNEEAAKRHEAKSKQHAKSASYHKTVSPGKGRGLINPNMLTTVFVRHKPVASKRYIRDQLQPYADKNHFVFAKSSSRAQPENLGKTLTGASKTGLVSNSFI